MNNNLLILQAGQYGSIVKEIAESMGCFGKIDFLDDRFGQAETDDNSTEAIGELDDLERYVKDYSYAIAAMSAPNIRKTWTERILKAGLEIPILVSPQAYVSKSVKLRRGDIVEPFAVLHSDAAIGSGVYVSAGAVINHNSTVSDFCFIDCNSVIMSNAAMSDEAHTRPCDVVRPKSAAKVLKRINDNQTTRYTKRKPVPVTESKNYNFDDGM